MMNLRSITILLIMLLLISCGERKAETKPAPELRTIKADFAGTDRAMTKALAMVGKHLKGLNKEQMASVAALVAMTRVATMMEGLKSVSSSPESFWTELPDICPPLPEDTMTRFGDCRDHDLSYGTDMAKCLDEGKTEAQCEKENYGSLEQAARCRMKQLEALNTFIELIPGRDWPHPPIPWPESRPGNP
jgi:hypothetical protein